MIGAERDEIKKLDVVRVPKNMTSVEKDIYDGILTAQRAFHKTAKESGWYVDLTNGLPIDRKFSEVVALMHSELSEALEADRKNLMDDKLPHRNGIEVELADLIIRVLDTAEYLNLDVAGALIEKNRYNISRQDHKISNRKLSEGKKH